MATKSYDAIVVGSGITGGWAAKEFGEKGLQTLVLEAGRPIDPDTDYAEHVPEWEMRYRGMSDRKRVAENQQVQETCTGMDEWNSKLGESARGRRRGLANSLSGNRSLV